MRCLFLQNRIHFESAEDAQYYKQRRHEEIRKKNTKRVGYLKVLAIWQWNRGGGSMFLHDGLSKAKRFPSSPRAVCPRLRGGNRGPPGACSAKLVVTVMVSKYTVWYGRQKQDGSYHVDRDISEEVKAVRIRLKGWPHCHSGPWYWPGLVCCQGLYLGSWSIIMQPLLCWCIKFLIPAKVKRIELHRVGPTFQ